MSELKPYKEQESTKEMVGEPIVAYTASDTGNLDIVIGKRDGIECAISGEELLSRLRPRIKALFE